MKEYWVLIEGGSPAEWGLLRHCAGLAGSDVRAVALLREGLRAETAFALGAQRAHILTGCADEARTAEAIARRAEAERPDAILFTADDRGRMIAARIAAKLGAGLAADCTALRREGERLVMTRPTFGGTLMADIVCPQARPQMATVRPGVYMPGPFAREAVSGECAMLNVAGEDMLALLEECPHANGDTGTADIIVAGGKGVGSREGFALLEELALRLGGAVGASRAAVNAGYAPYRAQIGLTGSTVQPLVYLAFGISGAVQHVVGMEKAKLIIAVNSDARAPIFEFADYGVVGDWREVAGRLLERI